MYKDFKKLNENMKNQVRITYGFFIGISLILSSCTETTAKKNSGNWEVKASELSYANPQYIKTDLVQLNPIIQSVDTQAQELGNQLVITATDPEKFEQVLVEFDKLQEDMQQKMMQLNLKSFEVHNIRSKMIESVVLSKKLYKLTQTPNFDITAPDEGYKKRFKQLQDMREMTRAELDTLNQQYP